MWESLLQAGRPHQAQEVQRDDQKSGVQAIAKDNRYHGGCSVAVISCFKFKYVHHKFAVIAQRFELYLTARFSVQLFFSHPFFPSDSFFLIPPFFSSLLSSPPSFFSSLFYSSPFFILLPPYSPSSFILLPPFFSSLLFFSFLPSPPSVFLLPFFLTPPFFLLLFLLLLMLTPPLKCS